MKDEIVHGNVIISYPEVAAALNETVVQEAPSQLESGSPLEQAAFLAALGEAMRQLEEETAQADPGVLVVPSNRLASLMLTSLAEDPPAGSTLESLDSGGDELKFAHNDIWGWFKSLFQWQKKTGFHPILRPASTAPSLLPNQSRIALIADWGTGLYGAPEIARSIEADPREFDLLMHLGDVYYSGTKKEIQKRFLDAWPRREEATSRALNSNHEMYSGGHGYFERTLPSFNQEASYFAMANDHWLLIGLDTGYVDKTVDSAQALWVEQVVKEAEGRRVLLFSHHQLFSSFESQGTELAAKLGGLLASGRVAAWYWGHEHRCILYDHDPRFGGLQARCIGHGGMPYNRKKVQGLPVKITGKNSLWRRVAGMNLNPGGLVLDGPNPFIAGKEHKYGPNGYLTLELVDEHLHEEVCDPTGEVIWQNDLE